MKVCFINSLYDPYTKGGAETVVGEQVRSRQQAGDKVIVITLRLWQGLGSLLPRWENINGARVCRFYPLNIFSFINIDKLPFILRLPWHFLDIFNWHSYFVIKKILQQEKPDLVLTHNLKGIGYLVWLAIKSLKIKNIHTLHDIQLAVPSGVMFWGKEKQYKIYRALCRYLIGSPDEVVSPSQWLMDFYTDRGFFKNSSKKVDRAFGCLPEIKQLELKPSREVIRLLYLGLIEESKGIIWLIEILKKLQATNYKLQIIGDGSKLAEVKKLVGDDQRFNIHGRVEGVEKDKIIRESGFLIFPSLIYENSPRVIAESLARGTPVIAADSGGVGEMVREGVNGYLFLPASAEDLLIKLKMAGLSTGL